MGAAEAAYFGNGENHIKKRQKVIKIIAKVERDGDKQISLIE